MDHITYMHRALELARLGFGQVAPNPMVGCVIVHNHKIIGEGYHQKYGEAHAEVNAVQSVADQDLLKESTVYVTLEPCAHHGKTPPCADLLVSKQVKKVVIACEDPFEQVDGKGIQKLEDAGIEVEVGILGNESKSLNKRFLTFHEKERPYIILKWAQTSDGFIARKDGDSKWISNSSSRQLVHKWRSEEDAILVGKNTAIRDNPSLTVRDWEGRNPVRILLDSNLEIKEQINLFNEDAATLIINSIKDDQHQNIQWIKTDLNNPWSIVRKLYEQKIQSLIIEGGTQVLNSFIAEDCWDEARIFTANVSFNEGIEAPRMEGTITHTENVLDDQLTIYQNTNG